MIPMILLDRASIEAAHLNALSESVGDKFQNLVKEYASRSGYSKEVLDDVKDYLKKLGDASVSRILIMNVQEQRALVSSVEEKFLSSLSCRRKEEDERKRAFVEVNKRLKEVFDYDAFARMSGKWGLMELALQLNKTVKVCPYCNGEYVFAFKLDKLASDRLGRAYKSPFDHYFPRARYPFLGLSLYNLIPSCSRCNSSMKKDKFKGLVDMTHPYDNSSEPGYKSMHEGMQFRVLVSQIKAFTSCSTEDIDAVLLTERIKGTYLAGKCWERMFRLNESYSNIYLGRVADAMCKSVGYTASYFEELKGRLSRLGLPVGDVERLVYGASLQQNDINRTPFAKMTIDVHEVYAR